MTRTSARVPDRPLALSHHACTQCHIQDQRGALLLHARACAVCMSVCVLGQTAW
jgi:hypothetical protein